ncbi:MAG: 4-hydroxy-tetrahydrodipicolinate reductase [Pacificimonas sp.]
MTSRIGILGAGGRMGGAIIAETLRVEDAELAGAAEHPGHPAMGQPIGDTGLSICANPSTLAHQCDVMVDFTTPGALPGNLEAAIDGGCALVIGTTGLTHEDSQRIDEAARHIAVLQTANTSLGVNMLAALVKQAATALGEDWDIEITEMHHKHKVDAPSGTALLLGEAAAEGRGGRLADLAERGRDGSDAKREPGAIGMASLRGGSVAGDHQVIFAADGERLELGHRAESREIFARGAVRAACWLSGKAAGRYGMGDVLGF